MVGRGGAWERRREAWELEMSMEEGEDGEEGVEGVAVSGDDIILGGITESVVIGQED